jgi:O-antigen ligase
VPEIARQLDPNNRLYPNPKNLYLRLLAETGLVGFFIFLAFLFSVLGDALRALQSGTTLARYLGIAGIFTWFAVVLYNVTQDSFATPNIWINFGILVGMTAFIKEKNLQPDGEVTSPEEALREGDKGEELEQP